jgi:AraC family transcriptional regulator
LDETAVSGVKGTAEELGRTGAAVARLTTLGAGRRIAAHTHDHPYLSLYVLGSYREAGDEGEALIDGPAAAFHPAGSAHEDAIGACGLATVVIEFDETWVRRLTGAGALDRSRYWSGGEIGRRGAALARAWVSGGAAAPRLALTEDFLTAAANDVASPARPVWFSDLETLTRDGDGEGTDRLAVRLGVSRPWLVRAYRQFRGEGLGDADRRRRVETAVGLIEAGALPLAEVAAEAGFCDQSHMNRAFRLLLGRTPAQVRATGLGLS